MFSAAATLALTIALQTAPAPAVPSLPPDQPILHIFQNLYGDLKRLPSIDTAAIVGTGIVAGVAGHHADRPISDWAAARDPAGYTAIGRDLGDGWTQGTAAVATYVVGLAAHSPATVHIGSDLIRAQVLNAVLTRGIKAVAGRPRPSGAADSMPSGHTTATFASAMVLDEHFGWKVGVPSFAMAGFVGWSRVRDRAHWLTDVLVGASIGVAAGHTVAAHHRGRRWAVVPVASPTGVALYYVR